MPKRKYQSPPSSSSTKSSGQTKRRRRLSATKIQAFFRGIRARRKAKRKRSGSRDWEPLVFGTGRTRKQNEQIRKNRAAAFAKVSFNNALVAATQRMEKMMEKKLAKRLPTKAQKRSLAGITENNFRTIYRKFSGRSAEGTLWNRGHGQLVLTVGTTNNVVSSGDALDPYEDPVSHRPYYHMDWSDYVHPNYQYTRLIGETDTVTTTSLPNYQAYWSGYAKVGGYSYNRLQTTGSEPAIQNSDQIGGLEGDHSYEEKFLDPHVDRVAYYGYKEKKVDLLPLMFHRKQLEGVLEESSLNDSSGIAQTWAQIAPCRLTDKIRINNLWLKFDFDTKFAGDEGTRNNVFTVDTQHLRELGDTGLSSDWNGYRKDVEYNNRITNMYAKVRIIVGKRIGELGESADKRVSLNHVLKADHISNYQHGHSHEELLGDLFSRGTIKRTNQAGINHTNAETDEYEDIRIIKDEIVTLGRGHSTKHYNLFKGHVLPYMATDNNENQIKDIYMSEMDQQIGAITLSQLYNRFGHVDIKDSQLNSTDMTNITNQADKLCIPLKNDMFMYVITMTRGASVRWRISSKLTYSSV